MQLAQIADGAYALLGGSNVGLLVEGSECVVVDAGLDRDSAKAVLQAAAALGISITAILITHAHADHFGGAALIRSRTGAKVYAPCLEAAIVANPLLEPLYLFSGAMPPADLLHKFTLAQPCPVDCLVDAGTLEIGAHHLVAIAAPGHAPNQMMYGIGEVLYIADACFAPSVLDKHVIPFCVDVDVAEKTLTGLSRLEGNYSVFVAGHGPTTQSIMDWARANSQRLSEVRDAVARAVSRHDELDRIVEYAAREMGAVLTSPVMYYLTRTTVLACLKSLASARVIDNRLVWQRP